MKIMLLLIDIGNTNTTIGFYDKGIKHVLKFKTATDVGSDKYSELLSNFIKKHKMKTPEGAVMCSVVPKVTPLISAAVKKAFGIKPLVVSSKIKTGLKFKIKNSANLGADRIAAAVGAHELYKGDLIIVDFGTATTLCVVTAKGEYRGGVIMPGIGISAEALHEKTAKLPLVKLKTPERAIGRDTTENILAGLVLGHAGGVERIIKEIKKEAGINPKIIATGGLADFIAPYINNIYTINGFLTLEGLQVIYELNA
jgi:type III pantothenate kinase